MDYNARYYSPYLNRFISPDTIIPDSADPQSFNRYAYVKNNPLKYTDPSGHFECAEAIGCTPTDSQRYRNTVPSFQEQAQIQENINSVLQAEVTLLTIPITAWSAPKALVPMLSGGTLGEAGYTGSVIFENWLDGEASLEGWNMGDGTASFLTGQFAALIPGSSNVASFSKGALQNGGGYALGQIFNGETADLGMILMNGGSGGLAGRFGDKLSNSLLSSNAATAATIRAASPILSSSTIVGGQNAIINEVSAVYNEIESYVQDPKGTYTTIWRWSNMPPSLP